MTVKAIPEGQHSITPYLGIQGASEAIEFYKNAFGAVEMFRLTAPDGKVGHAELKIGDSTIMLAEPCSEGPLRSAQSQTEGAAIGLHLYVEDVDKQFAQAIKAGGKEVSAVKDQFYGDRTGTLKDPYGNLWFLATHKEDLSPDEIKRRAAKMFGSESG
ncbi:hypothetical protein D3C76_73240 [compost metagenome]